MPAWRSGIAAARGRYVCLIDADLQNLPEDVWRLYREITLTGADLVQGYRSSIGRERDSRYFLSVGLNTLLNRLFGMRQHDNKSGFVIAERETLEDVLRHRQRYHYFQTFISVAAARQGLQRPRDRDALPGTPPGRVLHRSGAGEGGRALLRRPGEGRSSSSACGRKQESILEDYLRDHPPSPAPTHRCAAGGARGWRRFFATMPLHKWMISRRARDYYHELKRSQWLSPAEMRELQEEKLRRLVQHAYRHVPYYRERMRRARHRPGRHPRRSTICTSCRS